MDIAVDTNVLVRILIDDPSGEKQMEAARSLAKKARSIYVSQLVQAELVWVLTSAYGLKKIEVIDILEQLSTHSIFILQKDNLFLEALSLYKQGKANFADYLIAVEAKQSQKDLYTFDKKLAESEAKLCV